MKSDQFKRCAFAAAVLCLVLSAASAGHAQTVVSRARIGGYAEDISYVSSGKLKDHIVMLNGYEAYTVPVTNKEQGKHSLTKLCDMKFPEFNQFPNGITYVPSEDVFFVNQSGQTTKLFVLDQNCALKETRTIQYLNSSYRPVHMEGMAYIPQNSPTFPDHVILTVFDSLSGPVRFEVMRRDGVVVAEIYRSDWPDEFQSFIGVGDITFQPPNKLLVSAFDVGIYAMDFSGNILAGPHTFPEVSGTGEGFVQLGDGRFVLTRYPQGLLFFDGSLARLPDSDRHDVIGLNLNTPGGVAWNSDTNRLLFSHDNPSSSTTPRISEVPTTLDGATPVADLSGFQPARHLAYLPDEHLTAILRQNPANARAILLFNSDGTLNSQISLSPASLGQNLGGPRALTYIPSTHEFVVGFGGAGTPAQVAAERRSLRVFSRTGALVRTLDLTATGTGDVFGLDYFDDPGGGRFIVNGSAGRIFVTDLDGNSRGSQGFLIREFNARVKLGLVISGDVTAITTGPLAGAFALIDPSGGEIVIFRLD